MNKRLWIVIAAVLAALPLKPVEVKRIDFLRSLDLAVNGAGPMLVKADAERRRIVAVDNLSAAVSIYSVASGQLQNIAVANRPPQYLKSEALAIDRRSGHVYLVGDHALHVIFPEKGTSLTIATDRQYEMVAVDGRNGNAFLVGRESRYLAIFDLKRGKVRYSPWCEKEEQMTNLNATPPPPIRKVAVDEALNRVFALDGYTPALAAFDATSGKLLNKRQINLIAGSRWHWGGYRADTHQLVVAVETAERKVLQAAKIDAAGTAGDLVVPLPGLTEGVGIAYHAGRDELYIAYDNHPSVHVIDFKLGGRLAEIMVPAYGNDAAVIDERRDRLYVSSWAYGEIDQIDLKARRLQKRILNVGILPHMFNMAGDGESGRLYIPLGGTAVNGTFGAALTILDPETEKTSKVYTGWAPVELLPLPGRDSFLVCNSEDEAAEVTAAGDISLFRLPCSWPHQGLITPQGHVYLAYGPHQSYWPVVYIWGARNGILGIDPATRTFYDRRIPRLAQAMILDRAGALYALQNNWGGEKQFLATLADEVRAPNQGDMRLELEDTVVRETTQRLLRYDAARQRLYLARLAETDDQPGILQIIDAASHKSIRRVTLGRTPADMLIDDRGIYVANFASDSISVIDHEEQPGIEIKTGRGPLKLAQTTAGCLWVINHLGNSLQEVAGSRCAARTYPLPVAGRPDNLAAFGKRLILTTHNPRELNVLLFDPDTQKFTLLAKEAYPFGDTSFATGNCAFYLPGQFGDALYEIGKIRFDAAGRIWVSDFLSGRLLIIKAD